MLRMIPFVVVSAMVLLLTRSNRIARRTPPIWIGGTYLSYHGLEMVHVMSLKSSVIGNCKASQRKASQRTFPSFPLDWLAGTEQICIDHLLLMLARFDTGDSVYLQALQCAPLLCKLAFLPYTTWKLYRWLVTPFPSLGLVEYLCETRQWPKCTLYSYNCLFAPRNSRMRSAVMGLGFPSWYNL